MHTGNSPVIYPTETAEAYDNLTVYEKSLISESSVEKLNKLTDALETEKETETEDMTEAEKETETEDTTEKSDTAKSAADTGDNSLIELWTILMSGSLLVLLLSGRKRYRKRNR